MARRRRYDDPVPLGGPDQIQEAWRMLAGGAPDAVRTLVNISKHGRSEVARVQASATILDRVGLGAKPEILVRTVPVEFDRSTGTDNSASPTELIMRRLEQLETAAIAPATDDSEVYDAELVDINPWQNSVREAVVVDAEPGPAPDDETPRLS